MERKNVDINKVTPMMRQYLEIKNKNEDLIIFFRLGDFYEMFFEDAVLVSHELELTLTGKSAGLDERIPMCGIPYHAASTYIDKLIENGHKIGIVEQLEDPKSAKGIVERGIIQIVSSGTITQGETINKNDYNFIGSITDFKDAYGICYGDVTTGEIYAYLVPKNVSKTVSEIINLNVKEVILDPKLPEEIYDLLKNRFHLTVTITDNITEDYKNIYKDIQDERYKICAKHLLAYITNNQKRNLTHFQKLVIKKVNDHLRMDVQTKRNLELTETIRLKQRNFSLLWLLDKTKTAMGARTLKTYILNPLINKEEIIKRQNTVEILMNEFILKDDLEKLLVEVYDLERLSGKIALASANAKDFLQLKSSLKVLPEIKAILNKINYGDIECLEDLYNLLDKSIYENPPMTLKEGYLIKEGYSKELDELKSLRKGGKDFVANFEKEEREKTGIKNLKVAYNRVFGYYIEISKGNVGLVKEEWNYQRRQTLANCERYISPVLKEKESLILNAEEKIINLEYELFTQIRQSVQEYIPRLQKIAKTISEIDVLASFATVSEENGYVKPTFGNEIKVKDGRHPVLEKVTNGSFVSNDIIMDENTNILLITGPNMAGKSTYMRQMAIISIMAQIGCFVPAKEAKLKIFDAIYTRIGASDDLVSGESTFMVEMIEAANAIKNATDDSLLLFDELGRGTATYDGMALAEAIIEYIHKNIQGKTFFSTHYHELTELDKTLKHLKNIHVSAYEEDGKITFLHKIKEGAVSKSYGIHVAKLAHLPEEVIKRADEILKTYESKERKVQVSLSLDEVTYEKPKVISKLEKINPLEITPIEALNILYELKKDIDKH